jgi:pyruvate dehydrogenase E2 component (dihydrolipoamide acetyltransferase)
MPDLATTGTAIRVLRWLVKPGDSVKRGQVILEIETDKATMEVESTASGTLVELILKEGDEGEAGALMATVRAADAAASSPTAQAIERPTTAPGGSAIAAAAEPVVSAPARRGMFTRNARVPVAVAPGLSPAGRVSAQRLSLSKQTVPHFYLTATANAEPMLFRREALPGKPVWDAFFVRAVASSLVQFDRLACRFEGDALVRQESDAVGVAADIEGDLYVLRVDHPRDKTVEQISAEIRSEVEKIRQDAPGAKRPRPGAISISNLGSTGVEAFCAIINPPEAAILAIGAVAPRVCVVDGQMKIQRCVSLTLSVDHRVANGKYAANFLASVVKEIESL